MSELGVELRQSGEVTSVASQRGPDKVQGSQGSGWESEIEGGERFRFGENWARFLESLDEARIEASVEGLRSCLGRDSLRGMSFLDVGGGSGLHSLAAHRLGASKIHTFDFDPESVACAEELRRRYAEDDPSWTIERGSALDPGYLKSLGQHDVVYSWGVLHHTGEMWRALTLIADLPKPGGGLLTLAIYNDQGGASRRWRWIKRAYVRSSGPARAAILFGAGLSMELRPAVGRLLRGDNPLPFAWWAKKREERGMAFYTDLVDWVGGYPFEVAKPEEIFLFYRDRGYEMTWMQTVGSGHGCNEFTFRRR